MKRLIIIAFCLLFAMTGTAWAGLGVEFDWAANTETDLAGYNMYRSEVDGGPYAKIGSSTTTGYTDSTTEFDVTYFWVITAFDVEGNESGYSNQVSNMTGTPIPPDTTPPGTPQDINVTVHITIGN